MGQAKPKRRKMRAAGLILLAGAIAILAAALLDVGEPAAPASGELAERGVLIDPGHGGFDVGALGVSGAEEDKLNLRMAKALKAELESRGVPAALTRETDAALGETKEADMEARAEIIRNSAAALMVSIHMNSFPDDPTVAGPQMVFEEGSAASRALADALQPYLSELAGTDRLPMEQNLIVLSAAEGVLPAALIECGFLSNPEEEELLQSESYQKRFACAIADGIAAYCAD